MSQVFANLPDLREAASQIGGTDGATSQDSGGAIGETSTQQQRQARMDRLIGQTRATQPRGVAEQRSVQRSSIAEINAMDLGQIAERFQRSRLDTRPPLVRFLDLVDAPRNVIANVIFQGAADTQGREGDRAAFGLPRVNFSDALREMGVQNRVARGVVGFVGDVAMDPLTYLGPAGVGLRQAAKTGGQVAIGQAGKRALRRGFKDLEAGGIAAVRDPSTKRLLNTQIERLNRGRQVPLTGRELAQSVRRAVLGSGAARGTQRAPGARQASGRGGLLAERVFEPPKDATDTLRLAEFEAAQEFVKRYGPAGAPGIEIGAGGIRAVARGEGRLGSGIAHIPFTDLSIRVPGFTRAGRGNELASAIARSAGTTARISPAVLRLREQASSVVTLVNEAAEAQGEAREILRQANEHLTESVAGVMDFPTDAVRSAESLIARHADTVAEIKDDVLSTIERFRATGQIEGDAAALVQLGQMRRVITSAERRLKAISDQAKAGAAEFTEFADDLRAGGASAVDLNESVAASNRIASMVEDSFRTVNDYAKALDASIMSVMTADERALADAAKYALGINEMQVGANLFAPLSSVARRIGGEAGQGIRTIMALERSRRQTFGQSGSLKKALAHFKHGRGLGANQAHNEVAGEAIQRTRQLMDEHAVPAARLDETLTVLTAMVLRRRLADNPTAIWDTKFGTDQPAAFLGRLAKARASGLIEDGSEFVKGLESLADEYVFMLDDLGEQALDEGLMSVLRSAYVPLVSTPELRQLYRAQARSTSTAVKGEKSLPLQARESFQRGPRTTAQYRYDPEDFAHLGIRAREGEEALSGPQRFFEWQRVYKDWSLEEIRRTWREPTTIRGVLQAQRVMRHHDEMVKAARVQGDDEALALLQARDTDPFELNALTDQGMFDTLTGGGDLPRDFFETNLAVIMGQRTAQHRRAQAQASFVEGMQQHATIDTRTLTGKLQADGKTLITDQGLEVKVLAGDAGNPTRLLVGGESFRVLDPGLFKGENPMLDALGIRPSNQVMYHEHVAESIEEAARLLADEERFRGLLGAMETMTQQWKAITLLHPSWLVTNIFGDGILAGLAGLRPETVGTHGRDWLRVIWNLNDPQKLAGITLEVGGRKMTGQELARTLSDLRVIGTNRWAEAPMQFFRNGLVKYPEPRRALDAIRPGAVRTQWADAVERSQQAKAIADIPGAAKVAAGPVLLHDKWKALWSSWFAINGRVADYQRGLAFISNVENGSDFASAADRVIRNMYDYTDLTRAERKFRLAMPFYSFVKNSFVHWARVLAERPIYVGAAPKLFDAIEEAINGEATVPDHLRPAWMNEQMAIQIGQNPDRRWAILPGTLLPSEAVVQAAQAFMGVDGAQEFGHWFVSSLNPLATSLAQASVGREFFTGREIGPSSLEGDISVGEFFGQQIRPLRELGVPGGARTGAIPRAFEEGVGAGVARSLIGGRSQTFDEERLHFSLVREYDDRVRNLRKAIRLHEREGNAAASQRARTELLRVYDAMLDAGLDEVPKWAARQLAEISGGAPDPSAALAAGA